MWVFRGVDPTAPSTNERAEAWLPRVGSSSSNRHGFTNNPIRFPAFPPSKECLSLLLFELPRPRRPAVGDKATEPNDWPRPPPRRSPASPASAVSFPARPSGDRTFGGDGPPRSERFSAEDCLR